MIKKPLLQLQVFKMNKGILEQLDTCYSCRCGKCLDSCPVYDVLRFESVSPRGKVKTIYSYLQGEIKDSQEFMEYLAYCTLCGACEVTCGVNNLVPGPKVSVKDIVNVTRGELVSKGFRYFPYEKIVSSTVKEGNPFGRPNKERNWVLNHVKQNIKAEFLFWIGCTSTFYARDSVLSTIKLFDVFGLNFTVLGSKEKCCGLPLHQLGYFHELEKIISDNIEKIKELDVDFLVSNCPGCINFIRNYYKEFQGELPFKVVHTSEYISKNLDKLNLDKLNLPSKKKLNITFHDPCHLARGLGVTEEPRMVLKNIPGVDIIETPRNKLDTWCCGGSLRLSLPHTSTTIAAKRILQIPEKVNYIVTSCPTCKINLRDGAVVATTKYGAKEIKVLDLVDLLAELYLTNNKIL